MATKKLQDPGSATSYPVAFASLYYPSQRRRLYWLAYLCPCCGSGHFGRSDTAQAGGRRRSSCGRTIRIVIARTYKGKADSQ